MKDLSSQPVSHEATKEGGHPKADALFDSLVIDDMDCSVKRRLHFLYWANSIWNTVRCSTGHPLKERGEAGL